MTRFVLTKALAALVVLVATRAAGADTCDALSEWGASDPLPAPIYGHAVASDGKYVYSVGGTSAFQGCADTDLFRRYDPTNDNSWTDLAPVPVPVVGATLVHDAAAGRLFLFGGLDASCAAMNLVQVYDIALGGWTLSSNPMPGTRSGMGSGVIRGRIYLVGGHTGGFATPVQNQNWEFNPATGAYTPRASLPASLGAPGSAVSGGRLFIMGGRNDSTVALDSNYEYTPPPADVWVPRARLFTAVAGAGATALGNMAWLGGNAIVAGGQTLRGNTNCSQLYDIGADRWSYGPSLSAPRRGLRAARAGNTLVAFGGHDGVSTVTTVDSIEGSALAPRPEWFRKR